MMIENLNRNDKMKTGDMIFAEYHNGKLYTGEIVKVQNMLDKGILVTVNDPHGYKSLYVDKCVSCEVWEAVKN